MVSFSDASDFERINGHRWQWFKSTLAVIRKWEMDVDTIEDPLDSILQFMLLKDLSPDIWTPKVIGRIGSVLGISISAQLVRSRMDKPLAMEICVTTKANFARPDHVRLCMEKGVDRIVRIVYLTNLPYSRKCCGYDHWTRECCPVNTATPWEDHMSKSARESG